MLDNKLSDFIINGCYGEVKRYNKYKELFPFDSEEYSRGQWTYVVELMIITIKSLVPSMDKSGTIIDYNRFNEELKLWIYYRHGKNNALIKAICVNDDERYWTDIDDSIYSRIVPIVAANGCWDVIISEIIKNVLFTTGNIQILLEGILLSRLLHLLLGKSSITYDEIITNLKEVIIGLSQKHFIHEYQEFFRVQLDKYNGNYSIDFERNRIDIISLLNGIDSKGKYKILSNSLDVINKSLDIVEKDNFFINGLNAIVYSIAENSEIKDKEFIQSLCNYIIKLRKGRIASENLSIDRHNLVDIFGYNESDVFTHPLLNKCKVISKKEVNDILVVHIKSKSGTYRFMKRKQ